MEAKISEGKGSMSIWGGALLRGSSHSREKKGRGSIGSVKQPLIFLKDAGGLHALVLGSACILLVNTMLNKTGNKPSDDKTSCKQGRLS